MDLFDAVQRNDLLDVALALTSGDTDVNAQDGYGNTPIFYAQDIQVLEWLVDAGTYISHVNKNGFTCIGYRIDSSAFDILQRFQYLFDFGIRITLRDKQALISYLHYQSRGLTDIPFMEQLLNLYLEHDIFSVISTQDFSKYPVQRHALFVSQKTRDTADLELKKPYRAVRAAFVSWLQSLGTLKVLTSVQGTMFVYANVHDSDIRIRDATSDVINLRVHLSFMDVDAGGRYKSVVVHFKPQDNYTEETVKYLTDLVYAEVCQGMDINGLKKYEAEC